MIYAALALLAVLMAADTGMTLWAVGHGYQEVNPLMVWLAKSPARLWGVTVISFSGVASITLYLGAHKPWVAWLVIALSLVGAGYAVVHNFSVLSANRRLP
jgi:hypothetical protein